jgi:hypothetical protein
VSITIKQEDVTDDLVTSQVWCDEHGEIVFTIYPRRAAQDALAHRQKYPFCAPIKNAADS